MELKKASAIAVQLCYRLQPFCEKINIAGSIRRKKNEVKDIEIICVPRREKLTDLFGGEGEIIRSIKFIETVNGLGKIIKGNASGKHMQIELQPSTLNLQPSTLNPQPPTLNPQPSTINPQPSTINLDLFIPDDFDYYRQYAIRTGSADYAKNKIAAGWKKQGWCGSHKGLRKKEDCIEMRGADGKSKWKCINKNAALPPAWQSEEEFFRWIRVIYEKPMHRV